MTHSLCLFIQSRVEDYFFSGSLAVSVSDGCFFPQKRPVRTKLDIFVFIALLKKVENNFGRLIFKSPLNPQSLLYLNSS
jgi:hypothetical protein